MQIQLKYKSSSSEESGGEETRGSILGQFCRELPRQSDSALTEERREGCPRTGNAAQKGKSGSKGCKEACGGEMQGKEVGGES